MSKYNYAIILMYIAPIMAVQPKISPDGSGGGEYIRQHSPHLTEAQREKISRDIQTNKALIDPETVPRSVNSNISYDWPLTYIGEREVYGYYGISNYVDHNVNYPDLLTDYNCGIRSYDTSDGYNHSGTDYFPWPFPWNAMDNNEVAVVAIAPGVIVGKERVARRLG